MIIAIDGTAASGKGTLARNVAKALDFAHLDSGALYRAVALKLLRAGRSLEDEEAAAKAARALDPALLDEPDLRAEGTGKAASAVARYPAVRAALLSWQRDFAAHPPDGKSGAVIDGRDIGTVVCPDADVKIFVDADPRVRAERRALELEARGESADRAKIFADITARDAQDRDRTTAPLRRARDAYLLDSSEIGIEATLERALAIIEMAKSKRAAARQN